MTVTIGVSLKTYFSAAQARIWFAAAARAAATPAVAEGWVRVFVAPTYLQIPAAIKAFAGTPVMIAAQDVSAHPPGAFTGEVSAAELAELGVRLAEIGHAERRRLFGETDHDVAAKSAAAMAAGLEPVLCVGETVRGEDAAATVLAQLDAGLRAVPDGSVVIAYEPVWAIGAREPAPADHIRRITRALRAELDGRAGRAGSTVLYGGSAGHGLLDRLGGDVDGLFLGRFAHDPTAFAHVLADAALRSGYGERSRAAS